MLGAPQAIQTTHFPFLKEASLRSGNICLCKPLVYGLGAIATRRAFDAAKSSLAAACRATQPIHRIAIEKRTGEWYGFL